MTVSNVKPAAEFPLYNRCEDLDLTGAGRFIFGAGFFGGAATTVRAYPDRAKRDMNILKRSCFTAALVVGVLGSVSAYAQTGAQVIPTDQVSHIHALQPDPVWPSHLLIATHEGLFRADPDGRASRVSGLNVDMMAFALDPNQTKTAYASGHSREGGNLGLMQSTDAGATWTKVSDGPKDGAGVTAEGAADFHFLTVSPKASNVIYGVAGKVARSRDGGRTWTFTGAAPQKLFALSASPFDANQVYAATMDGLKVSADGGATWRSAYPDARPVTMVSGTRDGRLFAFVWGVGLVLKGGANKTWKTVSSAFEDRYLYELSADPAHKERLYALADTGQLMTSGDAGKSWWTFTGYLRQTPQAIAKGQALFKENCQSCHGAAGVGEDPASAAARTSGIAAPSLNNNGHGWHHSDDRLLETIADGSPRTDRMPKWKETLSQDQMENILAYVKSLWNFRSKACQGPKHMACMR